MPEPARYDVIGRSYRATRRPDDRLVSALIRLLDVSPGAMICDVGAGSGNYTNAIADLGFHVLAVEPSEVMRRQAHPHEGVTWYEGTAERLPLPDAAVSAVISTLAAHHFRDPVAAAREMDRVCPVGPLVLFTMDPRRGQAQWFAEYFPEIRAEDFKLFPPADTFAKLLGDATGRRCEIEAFPLPRDLTDQFMYAPWGSPETYLDATFRANTSGFAMSDQGVTQRRLDRLADDLACGQWDAAFGQFRSLDENDAGFCFIILRR